MAMTGDGTQDSPYLVDTIISFRAALQQDNAYIKLVKDLDCNAELQEWTTVDIKANDIDLNGHRFLAPYVQSEQVLFNGRSGYKPIIHDGYILGIGEAGAKYIGYYVIFKNIAMSCYLATCTNHPFYFCDFDNCNTWIKNSNSNNISWFYGGSNNFMKNSRFVLRGQIYKVNSSGSSAGVITISTIDNCLFEGELYDNSTGTNYASVFSSATKISNSVIDLTKKSTSKDISLHYSGGLSSYIDNTLLRDGVFSNNNSAFILCTPEEIRSVAHSDEVGFNVVEVK